jgi:hypothetical protein
MVQRIALAACAVALFIATLLIATAASAQTGGISGVVTHVDPAARIVYFTDGRWVRLEPGTKITVDGREVTMASLKPGTSLVVWGPAAAPSPPPPPTVPSPPPAMTLSPHPPIDASGVVAKVDQQTGVITFQDGRMVKVTDRTRIWQQPASVGSVKPGAQVFLSNAQPVAFQFSGSPPAGGRYVMGTVVRVDPASSLAVLGDGTLVRVTPSTNLHMDSRPVTIHQLQPGDQLVIWQRDTPSQVAGAPSTGQILAGQSTDSPSALPRQGVYATIDADEVVIIRKPQAP